MADQKTMVERLDRDVLGAVRQRLGAKDENDASLDDTINEMDPVDVVRAYSGWHLGSEDWGERFVNIFEIASGNHG